MTNSSPLILGIDPGYDRVGWAVGGYNQQKKVVIESFGCIQTDKNQTTAQRYQQIVSQLSEILSQHSPEEVALESIFFTKNQTTAMQVAEARGLIIGTCLTHTNQLFNYTPSEIKSAVTGNGAAPKSAVAKMVALQTGVTINKVVDDAIDAIAVVITHLASRQVKRLQPL